MALRSNALSDEESLRFGELAREEEIAQRTGLGQGFLQSIPNLGATLANTAGGLAEPFAPNFAEAAYAKADDLNRQAQAIYNPAPQSWEQVNGLRGLLNYGGNAIGSNLLQMGLTLPFGGLAGAGLRGLGMKAAAANFAGMSAAQMPLLVGENIGEMRQDPEAMQHSAGKRLGNAVGAAALQAPLDALGDALLFGRATGAGRAVSNVFKNGVGKTVKDSAKHVAMGVPEAFLTEGAPEAGQEWIKQQMLNRLNPNRDRSGDAEALKESFIQGTIAGMPTSVLGRTANVAHAQVRGAGEALSNWLDQKQAAVAAKAAGDTTTAAPPPNALGSLVERAGDTFNTIARRSAEAGETVATAARGLAKQFGKNPQAAVAGAANALAERLSKLSDLPETVSSAVTRYQEAARHGVPNAWKILDNTLADQGVYAAVQQAADYAATNGRDAAARVQYEAGRAVESARGVFEKFTDGATISAARNSATSAASDTLSAARASLERAKTAATPTLSAARATLERAKTAATPTLSAARASLERAKTAATPTLSAARATL